MNKQYDVAIVIGRFQPVHNGHMPLFATAKNIAHKVLILVGSSNTARSLRNPFTCSERVSMLQTVLNGRNEGKYAKLYDFRGIKDQIYQNAAWVQQVQDVVSEFCDEYGIQNPKIALVGHEKDHTTTYLKDFDTWDFVSTEETIGPFTTDIPVSATQIRELIFSRKAAFASGNMPKAAFKRMKYLIERNSREFKKLTDWYTFMVEYNRRNQTGEFPTQFLATDAVVVQGSHILMIRRKGPRGAGQWALPGGFVQTNETFKHACIRELLEETRIKVPKKVLEGSIKDEHMFDSPERSYMNRIVTMAYFILLSGVCADGTLADLPKVKGSDDAEHAVWLRISDVQKMEDQIYSDHLHIINYFLARA